MSRHPTDVVERAKAASDTFRRVCEESDEMVALRVAFAVEDLAAVVPELVAEVERLRDGLARIEEFSRLQALSDRVRRGPASAGLHSEERYWLDLLAIIERVQAEEVRS